MTAQDAASPVTEREDGEPVTRRAPFSDNPRVGARGQRTRQRILDAALQVFGDEGFHRCSIARISEKADCSRVSFYQYFSGKEDVFGSLAGQVARQISASTEAIDPLTPDAQGWDGAPRLGGPLRRHPCALRPDLPGAPRRFREGRAGCMTGAARLRDQTVARIRSKLSTGDLPPPPARPAARPVDRLPGPDARRRRQPAVRRPGGLFEGAGRGRPHRRAAPFALRAERRERASQLLCASAPGGVRARDPRHVGEGRGHSGRHRPPRRPAGTWWRTAGTCSSSGAITPHGSTTWPRRPASPTASSTATSRTRINWPSS